MAETATRGRHSPRNSPSRRLSAKADIWIVDADPLFRKGVQKLLNGSPGLCCTHAFSRCDVALEALRTDHVPEVILLECIRRGNEGIEALHLIRSISPSTSVIMLMASEEVGNLFDAIRAGASGTMARGAPPGVMVQGVKQVLSGRAAMSAAIARRVLEMFPKGHPTKLQYHITVRELELLTLLAEGLGTKEVASRLCVSHHTIDTHLKNIYAKLHMHSGAGSASKVLKEHLL
jgi:DNA-binding NarL/FixJ family response regulator